MKYFFFALMLACTSAYAQFVSVPYTMHTPGGNFTMNQHIYMPMNYGSGTSNPKFEFKITLKNDSIIKFKSRIDAENKKMYVVMKEKGAKRKVFPNETKSILAYSNRYGLVSGFPADSCWLYKVKAGAINCYTSVPLFDIDYTMAIQKGLNGEIVGLTKKNLEEMTGTGDEKIAKLIKKGKLVQAIQQYNEQHLRD